MTINENKEEFIAAVMNEGYTRECAEYMLDTREPDEDWDNAESCASFLSESFNEYDDEKAVLDAVSEDTALDGEEPTMGYVYDRYCVYHLDNGHIVLGPNGDPQ